MTFGEKLKNLRESRYMTQQKLADALKLSQSTVAAYESGTREPSFANIQMIADYFNVPFSSLIPSSDVVDDDYVLRMSDLLNSNPKIKKLFDVVSTFSDQKIEALLIVAQSMQVRQE